MLRHPNKKVAFLMSPRKILLASAALAVLAAAGFGISFLTGEAKEARMEQAMAKGGYVIYLRHAARQSGPKEPFNAQTPLAAFSDCRMQRNLSVKGRAEAVKIGRAFQAFGVPVGDVYALPLCRTRETAELAFGRVRLETQLYDAGFVGRMLAARPAEGTNTILVDTEDQVYRLAGVALAPGEAAVFKPNDNGGYDYAGLLDQDDLIR